MKTSHLFLMPALLPLILGSCSAYQKVSLLTFNEYKVSYDERENLQYVLKTHNLHYSDADRRVHSNYYEPGKTTIYKSHSVHIEDNIVIPTGACGGCVNINSEHFVIDFGEGVLVPFKLYNEYATPKSEIVVDERRYRLKVSNRNSCLYFDTRGCKASNFN